MLFKLYGCSHVAVLGSNLILSKCKAQMDICYWHAYPTCITNNVFSFIC